ncbi:MAG: putative outer membrane repeat protein [Pseudoalteromonas tetraodonis]|jgi:predicted outer membrane repeat protein
MRNSASCSKQPIINKPGQSPITLGRKALRPSLLAFAIAQALAAPVMANTIIVNDNGDGGFAGTCTLRQAIASANTNTVGTSNCLAGSQSNHTVDTIEFAPSVVYNGTISLTSGATLLINNHVDINAPGASNLEIVGQGGTTIFSINNDADFTLNNLTITGAVGNLSGFPILANGGSRVTLRNSTVSDNGGHIQVQNSSTLNIIDSTVSGNSSANSGGAIFASLSVVNITNSTVSGNTSGFRGGVIYAYSSTVNINNSTFSDNEASQFGGAIAILSSTLNIDNSIVAGNSAGRSHEIENISGSGTITSSYNILGDSGKTNDVAFKNFTPDSTDITATSDSTTQGTGTPAALTSILAPLSDNGGPTQTHALVEGSPALGAGNGTLCTDFLLADSNDQRGLPRNSVCDIGAFEAQTLVTITVGNKLDETGSCSLRDAIDSSNSNTAIGGCVAGDNSEQIVFDPAVFPMATPTTIALNSPLPTIRSNMTITGQSPSGLTIDGSSDYGRVFHINRATVGLNNLTITGGSYDFGAGIYAESSNVSLSNSTVEGNSVLYYGGGIFINSSKMVVSNSTISRNSAQNGGGIYAYENSDLELNNSTVSGNSADNGGGIYSVDSRVSLVNSTISDNSAQSKGGGIFSHVNTTTILRNSIIAGNRAPQGAELTVSSQIGEYQLGGLFITNNNLLGDSSNDNVGAFFGDFTPDGTDITATFGSHQETGLSSIVAPLANNGSSSTQTHALKAGSPAVDAGDDVICAAEPINNLDQRGEARPVGNACDIGAFEGTVDSSIYVIPLPNGKAVIFSL